MTVHPGIVIIMGWGVIFLLLAGIVLAWAIRKERKARP